MTLEEQIQKLTAERDAALKQVEDCKDLSDTIDADLNLKSSDQSPGDRLRPQFVGLLQAYRKCREKLEAQEKACAEFKKLAEAVKEVAPEFLDDEKSHFSQAADHALQSECGKGYVKAKSLKCFKCDDGHTPLYCLNCARDGYHADSEWQPVVEALKKVRGFGRADMGHQQMCDYVTSVAEEALAHAEKLMGKEKE